MRSTKVALLAAIATIMALLIACGGDDSNQAVSKLSDEEQIQEVLTEALVRWKHGDRGALYDNEFDYLQDRLNFDEYIKARELATSPDTVRALKVTNTSIYDRDSAIVDVDVVFEGPTGKVSTLKDTYTLYWHRGRWIRPTLSSYKYQKEYEELRAQAESAAAAEAEELGDE